jgi:hypothetical protein
LNFSRIRIAITASWQSALDTPNDRVERIVSLLACARELRPFTLSVRRHRQWHSPISLGMHNRRHACVSSGNNYMEVAVTAEKSVLVIGLEPTLIDFSHPDYANTGMDATKVLAGLKSSENELTRRGYSVQMCLTDFGQNSGGSCSKPTQAEAVRLHPYRGRCTNESKQLHAV